MPTSLMLTQHGKYVTVVNTTIDTVLLTDLYSEDHPDVVVRPTGLETEAQELLPGESFQALVAPTFGYRDYHITIDWIDGEEKRGRRTQRFN